MVQSERTKERKNRLEILASKKKYITVLDGRSKGLPCLPDGDKADFEGKLGIYAEQAEGDWKLQV